MTLEEKTEEYVRKYLNHKMAVHDIFEAEVVQKDVTRLLVDFSTEATKKLQEKNCKLEEQIEKMKCCFNCKHSRTEYEHCKTDKHEKWELKN